MKTFIVLVVFFLLAVGGYFGYQMLMAKSQGSTVPITSEKTGITTKTGVVQKLSKPIDDYTHMLRTSTETIKLNSYTVKLDQYVNKTITVEGQYSGNTLFVDAVK